ncbi:SLBB domain-containing protein [Phenylobacterium sp.]|uniref:SLBB domain-containing protein n=1 Tax=Phenylobacterium sp. TaxID=1871053 RepID=UPI00391C47F9
MFLGLTTRPTGWGSHWSPSSDVLEKVMGFRSSIAAVVMPLCLAIAAAGSAWAQTPAGQVAPPIAPQAAETEAAAPEQNYILGPDDVVEVEVLGRADFRTRARIGADGKIQLPFLGDVEAANRTSRELGEQIARALEAGGYFNRPVMRVEVVGYASRYVTVLGAVNNPGLVPINRAYRISEIIARVGGVRTDGADHVIIRPENGAERRIDLKTMAMGGAEDDPYVSAGDKIFAPTAEIIYLSGQVRSPGAVPMNSDMTFRMAIARAGGITELGSERRVQVTRGGEKLKRVDLDSKVQPGDIINVGERLF